MDLQNWT